MRQLGLTHDACYPSPERVSRARLNNLGAQVARSVTNGSPEGPSALVVEAIKLAAEAFVSTGADVGAAVAQAAPLLDKIGCREAYRHPDASRLNEAFKMANIAVQRGLVQVVGDLMTSDVIMPLRQDLMAYLAHLHRVAMAGFDRASRLVSLTNEERIAELRAVVFKGASPRDVDQLATTIGFDPGQRVITIISIHHLLPQQIRDHPQILVDDSAMMALMAEEWTAHLHTMPLHGQIVLGPASTVDKAYDCMTLARSAAALLKDGTVTDDRLVVPSIDLLGELLVRGNRLLAELLIDKHLSALEALPAGRRLALAQVLRISLERGLPMNRIARELGIAAQTAHNRMTSLRSLLGPKLDDADQRLELIIAVRAGLNRWGSS